MYQVHVVPDEELPNGVRRVLVERVAEDPLLILSATAAEDWHHVARLDTHQLRKRFRDADDALVVPPGVVAEALREVAHGCA